MIKLVVLIFFLVFQSQEDKINVSSSVDKSTLTIGDKVTYKITIDYDKKLKIEAPGSAINLGYFEISDYKIHAPKENSGRISEVYEYTISTFDTGKYVIPPFPVSYFETSDRSDFNYIEAPELELYVNSIFLNDSIVNAQPRTVKGLKNVNQEVNYLLIGLLIFVGLLIIGFLLWYFKFRKVEELEHVITPLNAHEVALKSLKELINFKSDNLQEVNDYYTSLSMVLRRFIEQRFEFEAVEQTTTELRESLRLIDITSAEYNELMELLPKADMVKFAKEIPAESEFKSDYDFIYQFVDKNQALETEVGDSNE